MKPQRNAIDYLVRRKSIGQSRHEKRGQVDGIEV